MFAYNQPQFRIRFQELRLVLLVMGVVLAASVLMQVGLDAREGVSSTWQEWEWLPLLGRYLLVMVGFSALTSLLNPQADQLLMPLTALLGGLGLMMIYRLPTPINETDYATRNLYYVERQALFLVLGQGVMLAAMVFRPLLSWLRRYRYLFILAGLGLLLITALFGEPAAPGGPRVSLNLGFFQFQPAEFIKLLFVVFLSSYLDSVSHDLRRLTYSPLRLIPVPHLSQLRPILLILGTALVFLVFMSDLGAALLIFFILPAMMYVALPRRVFWYMAGLALVLGYLMLMAVDLVQAAHLPGSETPLLEQLPSALTARVNDGWARVMIRWTNYQDPWAACEPGGECTSYQNLQGLYAIAAGGLLGRGAGEGLPENGIIIFGHTDMIFAPFVEEWGVLFGGIGLILVYWLLIRRGLQIARQQSDPFNRLLATGITTIFALQVFIIVGGTLSLIPFTGITVPFLSAGGTSVLANSLLIGLLLNLSAQPSAQPLAYPLSQETAGNLHRLEKIYGGAMAFLVMGTVYWGVIQKPVLDPAFPRQDKWSNNEVAWERQADWLRRVDRGRILASDGMVLASNTAGGRSYTVPSLVHVLGQVNGFGQALSGLELTYNERLLGRGRYDLATLWAQQFDGSWQGNDLTLTIDSRWQQLAHEALGGYNGAVVVLDAETGAVLAMVSHPLYDPNLATSVSSIDDINNSWDTPYLNRATDGLYPPGSTFKTVVGATAISQELVTPETVFDFSSDIWYWENGFFCHKEAFGGAVVPSCNSDLQVMSFAEGYADSDNVLFATLAVQLGAQQVWQGAAGFGFGELIPFDLPVAPSQLADDISWLQDTGQLAMTGFGQSQVQVTPMQMALVAAAIANDGEVPPTVSGGGNQ